MPNFCKVEGCSHYVHCRGLCNTHYDQWRHHGYPEADEPIQYPKVCSVPGCGRSDKMAKGLCGKHYTRLLRHGDPLAGAPEVLPRPAGCSDRTQRSYRAMRTRCECKNNTNYPLYGGRGIKICDRWSDSTYGLTNFFNDMGDRPEGMTLDRIDVNGDYCPENCRWANLEQQNNNRRSSRYITYNGKTQSISQWSRETGVNHRTLGLRLRRGIRGKALFVPTNRKTKTKD